MTWEWDSNKEHPTLHTGLPHISVSLSSLFLSTGNVIYYLYFYEVGRKTHLEFRLHVEEAW